MRDEAYTSILSSILISWTDDRQRQRAFEYTDHARKQLSIPKPKHDVLFQEASKCHIYVLEVMTQLPTNQNLVISIFNEKSSRQQTINSGEHYKFDLGVNTNYKIKFSVTKFNGENRKAVVRSSSLIKRVMLLDRKEEDTINLNNLQLNVTEKRCVEHKNHCYFTELKLTKESRPQLIKPLQFSDFLEIIQTFHEKEAMSKGFCEEYNGELCDKSQFILDALVEVQGLPHITIPVTSLSVFLVWDNSIRSFDETLISQLTNEIRGFNVSSKCSVLEKALIYLSECVQAEMSEMLDRFRHLTLFPPSGHHSFKQLNSSLKTVIDICVLPIWDAMIRTNESIDTDVLQPSSDPSNHLASALKKMLIDNCLEWIDELKDEASDLKQACLNIHAMSDFLQHNYQSANLFYHQFFINYIEISLETIDEQLEEVSKAFINKQLECLNSRSSQELELFSKCTMRFYETLASISTFARQNNVLSLRLHNYELWFASLTVYWTFSWRQLSTKMVERTISLEDDDCELNKSEQKRPLPSGIYSFLCIQKGLSDDYTTLAFHLPQNIHTATISLINIFCENTHSYARKLFTESLSKDEKIEHRVVRAINGIEQATDYISERWKIFVRWEVQQPKLSIDESESIMKFVETALSSTKSRCNQLMSSLVKRYMKILKDGIVRIARLITLDSAEYMKAFKSYRRDISPLERLNSIIDSFDCIIDKVRAQLLPRSFSIALGILFEDLEREIEKHLKSCQPPEYYRNIYISIKAIMDLLELPINKSKLINTLHYRSFSTQELILSYFSHLCDLANDDQQYQNANKNCPFIQVQTGYLRTCSSNMLILVNVREIINLPVLNPLYDRMDLYVKLEFFPRVIFPEASFPPQKTKILSSYKDRTWNQTFQFLIPENNFYMYGVSLCISVFDHSRLCDQLLGRTFVSVSRLPLLQTTSVQSNDIVSYALLRPTIGHSHPFFQMLKDRGKYDDAAKKFLSREHTAREMYVKIKRLSSKIAMKKKVFQLK
ncbi:unnamed protein product [Auanema sp. JU1783]|nr:unnamed protein product [Auanema sp. JU1783]